MRFLNANILIQSNVLANEIWLSIPHFHRPTPFFIDRSASAPDAVHPDDVFFRNAGDRPFDGRPQRPVADWPVRITAASVALADFTISELTAKFGGPLRHHAHHLL